MLLCLLCCLLSFINGLLQYFGNTSCHYQAKISKEKTNIINSNT
jgi:hypothetical protein